MGSQKKVFALFVLGCVALSEATVPIATIFDKPLANKASLSKIIGGYPACRNAYPYQVGVESSASNIPGEADGFCGGSLISKNVVLTAAHCVDTYDISDVILGTTRVLDTESTGYTKIRVESKLLHPDFDLATLDYDIAMLFLKDDAPLSNNIQPVLLPRRGKNENLDNLYGVLTGWGKTSDGSGSNEENLMEANVQMVNNQQCVNTYGDIFVNDRKVCLSSKGGTLAPCHGDSGGPLTYKNSGFPTEVVQVGLVSFGDAKGCESGSPTVFTRITSYVQWIADNGGPAVRN